MRLRDRLVAGKRTTIVRRPLMAPVRVLMSGGLLALAVLVAISKGEVTAPVVAIVLLCCAAAWAFWNSCAFLCISERDVRLGLAPLRFAAFRSDDIEAVRAVAVRPLGREWGSRGRPRGDGGLFLDVDFSTRAVEFELRDGRSYSVGTGGFDIDVETLRRRLGLEPA